MKKFFQLALLAVMVFATSATLSAQKYGFVDATKILAELPDMKAANSNLEGLQKQLQKKGQAMVQEFQTDYAALEERVNRGELAPKEQQTEASKLEARQQQIAQFEQKMISDLEEKRAELLEPIYESVNTAIEEVAKEGGYMFIFNKQTLLYGMESADVSSQVRSKLGL